MPRHNVTDAERCGIMERWEEMHGTLGGSPSIISGRSEPFALVRALDGSGRSATYAWPTLRRLVNTAWRLYRVSGRVPKL